MAGKLTPREIATHPIGAFMTVFGTLSLLFQFGSIDVLMAFIWTNLAALSTVFGIFGFTVIPQIDLAGLPVWLQWLNALAEAMQVLAIILFVGFAFKKLLELFNELRTKLT